ISTKASNHAIKGETMRKTALEAASRARDRAAAGVISAEFTTAAYAQRSGSGSPHPRRPLGPAGGQYPEVGTHVGRHEELRGVEQDDSHLAQDAEEDDRHGEGEENRYRAGHFHVQETQEEDRDAPEGHDGQGEGPYLSSFDFLAERQMYAVEPEQLGRPACGVRPVTKALLTAGMAQDRSVGRRRGMNIDPQTGV
ncbi:hypothetical protein ACIBN5_06220, partial [Streptomyces sp. NPDC050255]